MKTFLLIILFVAGCIIGYLVCDNFNKPSEIFRTVTVIKDVDSTKIIQDAKAGMITLAEAKKRFGKTAIPESQPVIVDNAVIDSDSVLYNNDDVLIEYAIADTAITLEKYTETDSIKVILELEQEYYGQPIGKFITNIVLKEFSHTHTDTLKPIIINEPSRKQKAKYIAIGACAGIVIFETLRIVTKLVVAL
jgi:hypothetical protein